MEKIKISNDQGLEKEYDVIFEFTSKNDRQHYIVYTNYEKDENNNINCYASIYKDNKLKEVTETTEINYITSMLEAIANKAKTKYKLEDN